MTRSQDGPPQGRAGRATVPAPTVRDLLAVHAAARERTADEHMFTVSGWSGHRMGTFRLQLFTAPGTRPVAVATQLQGEGDSLANWAEKYATEVWRQNFPASAEPPIWITLQLRPGHQGARPERFTLVTFRVQGPHELSSPQWCQMTDADVTALAGVPVSRDRGEGYQPWPREPDPEPAWHVAWTILLPRPRGMDRGCITAAPPWWRCLARQVIPRRAVRDCCYYHSVSWRRVSAAAIRVTRQARREGLAGEAFGDRLAILAQAQGLPAAEEEALADLLADHSAIQPGPRFRLRRGYTNGRHRTTAMLDSGVRRTVVIRWRYPR
jgi:hypothetical protein